MRRIIGDLSDRERVLIGLDLLYEELSDEVLEDEEAGDDDGLLNPSVNPPIDPLPSLGPQP